MRIPIAELKPLLIDSSNELRLQMHFIILEDKFPFIRDAKIQIRQQLRS